jgi:hypothetical protein
MSPQIVTKPITAAPTAPSDKVITQGKTSERFILPSLFHTKRSVSSTTATPKFGPTHAVAVSRAAQQAQSRAGRSALRPLHSTDEYSLVQAETKDVSTVSELPGATPKPQIISTVPPESITAASSVSAQPITEAVETTAEAPAVTEAGAGIPPMFWIVGAVAAFFLFGSGGSTKSKGAQSWQA